MEKNNVTNEVSITKVSVKKEEDIKEFAETAMNELLGWYGYETPRPESKVLRNCRSHSGSNDSDAESLKFTEGCGWCGKPVDENTGLVSAAAVFCSELCFSQSRRASFKRNKTCDWCRHIRHTVSYVDFQDGASQLQFCSDKCLNQYKMHIFCRETRAHLQLHPHLHGDESSSGALITPDLWLRNCESPVLRSPSPTVSPKINDVQIVHNSINHQPPPLPLISVAHSSKLLATDSKRNRQKAQKKFVRKKCPSTVTSYSNPSVFSDAPEDLRVRHTPPAEDEPSEQPDLKPFLKEEKTTPCSRIPTSIDCSNDLSKDTSTPQNSKISPSFVKAILGSILPPPTVFVPYPVILPLPIPIPIPIPIPKMFKSNTGKDMVELKDSSSQTEDVINTSHVKDEGGQSQFELLTINSNRRPLRKRKTVAVDVSEQKPKIFVRHKKTMSTTR